MTPEAMLELWESGEWDDCRKRSQIVSCDMEGWEFAEEGDYTQDHKYQYCTSVIRHIESGRCFMVYSSRSGSYHTDWYYTYYDAPAEVKAVTRTIVTTDWEAV